MARKTNKTEHVLNLISKAKEEHQTETDLPEVDTIEKDISEDLSFMDSSLSNDTEISNQIGKGLIEAVQEDSLDISSSDLTAEQLMESISPKPPSLPEDTNSDQLEETQTTETSEEDVLTYQYLNVLEELVKNRVEEFLIMFDGCTCPRCKADATALALNGLPPKYIVVDKSHVSPLLNFFSNHYKGAVTAQLSKACTVVKENPHH